jgi:hypothetical protein
MRMANVEYGRSRVWLESHCGICKKKFDPYEERVKGHAVFDNNRELDFLACANCAKEHGVESVK